MSAPGCEVAVARFFSHVKKGDGCWLWLGSKNTQGYGRVCWRGKARWAHRVSFEIANGSAPPSTTYVCHRCDNPACVRPDHLFTGTSRDNMHDCVAKGRHPNREKTVCANGHPLTGENVRHGIRNDRPTRACKACSRDVKARRRRVA